MIFIVYVLHGAVCFQLTLFAFGDCENIRTFPHQIGRVIIISDYLGKDTKR